MIIIAGLPRTGTSWLANIINRSDDVLIYNEPDTGGNILESFPFKIPIGHDNKIYSELLSSRIGRLSKYNHGFKFRTFYRHVSHVLGIKKLRETGFKTINSHLRLGWLRKELQYPRTLYIVRDPFSYSLALYEHWKNVHRLKSSLARQLRKNHQVENIDLSQSVFGIIALAWKYDNEYCVKENMPTGNFRMVNYNELCKAPADTLRDIFSFLELPYDAKIKDYVESSMNLHSSPLKKMLSLRKYSTIRDPAVTLNRWRSVLKGSEKDEIYANVRDSFLFKHYEDDH